jgi:hypothetical protein
MKKVMHFLSHFRHISEQHFKIKGELETYRRLFEFNTVSGNGYEVEALESMMKIMMLTNISKLPLTHSFHIVLQ